MDGPEETGYTYYLPDNFAKAESSKAAYNSLWGGWKQKYRKKYKDMAPSQFKKDLEEFVDFIGPFKNDKLYEGADTVKAKIEKIADTDYLRGRERDIVSALSGLSDDSGVVRILRGLKNSSKTIKAVANAVLGATKRKEKEVQDKGGEGEVVDLGQSQQQSARDKAAARRPQQRTQSFMKKAMEGKTTEKTVLKESKTIERWKTLAGIK